MRNLILSISRMLADMEAIGNDIHELLNTWVGPIFTAIGAVGIIYVIVLGIQYIKSENDSKRAEVKSRMINCVIGIVVIIILVTLCFTVNWASFVSMFGYADPNYGETFIRL